MKWTLKDKMAAVLVIVVAIINYCCLFVLAQDSPNISYKTSFVLYPKDTNANPPMAFGGKLLAEMDKCSSITARRFLYKSKAKDAVTILINNVKFHAPAQVKDLIIVSATITEVGEKSITMKVRVEKETEDELTLLIDGEFVFVAYDLKTKTSIAHGLKLGKR